MPDYNQNYSRQSGGYQGSNTRGNDSGFRKEKATFDFNPWNEKIKTWVRNEIDKETISFADEFGGFIAGKAPNNKNEALTTSQIRIAFGELRKIQMNGFNEEKTSFLMLKAKLAYAVKRHDKIGLTEFYNLFSKAYNEVDTKNVEAGTKQFDNLLQIIEAVLAYHKYHGGKE
ncbi:type III-A CRISPR-associated protein Csm2 [Ilyomonas limi]|uniref:CRISPR system Cms protein Csm2 n=1 Tax=Ilyomonas limi TaxID=2575867 RepID=A0A4U3KW43_9BACT|nr:type III-A CRISPR-associated protein Csm2 [Ilyomonas limi]TKK65854.1 type III-A CRISPR-associated protein Csm2 [Ilyomonas limi]